MSDYPFGSVEDRNMLRNLPIERLLDFFFLQIRNLWRVDGLYFLGIEDKFGTEAATKIDANVWQVMAKIEAKSLQRLFQIDGSISISTIIGLLQKSSWALDQPFKTIQVSADSAILTVDRCRTQETRQRKGLTEFPCKKVRSEYLQSFAQTLNPKVKVNCIICPPDKHPPNLWCRWEFRL
ncbi:MAG: DUF6125 family protein [Candidatus Bathyarchaeota archaeon]|jgi:hypothetical protein